MAKKAPWGHVREILVKSMQELQYLRAQHLRRFLRQRNGMAVDALRSHKNEWAVLKISREPDPELDVAVNAAELNLR
jgi:hypothetical protein